MFTRLFVQNPIFTNVIAIIAVILGIVSLTRLPIALYPDITPPTIAVSATSLSDAPFASRAVIVAIAPSRSTRIDSGSLASIFTSL